MKNLGSKGFTLVEGLLILVIVGIIGGAGYYVLNQSRDKNGGPEQANSQGNEQKQNIKITKKYDCKTSFSIQIPEEWHTFELDNGGNCVVSNLDKAKLHPLSIDTEETITLIFSVDSLGGESLKDWVRNEFKENTTYPKEIKNEEVFHLSNNQEALMITSIGGPYSKEEYNFYYKKGDQVISTSWESISSLKDEAIDSLKTIN